MIILFVDYPLPQCLTFSIYPISRTTWQTLSTSLLLETRFCWQKCAQTQRKIHDWSKPVVEFCFPLPVMGLKARASVLTSCREGKDFQGFLDNFFSDDRVVWRGGFCFLSSLPVWTLFVVVSNIRPPSLWSFSLPKVEPRSPLDCGPDLVKI